MAVGVLSAGGIGMLWSLEGEEQEVQETMVQCDDGIDRGVSDAVGDSGAAMLVASPTRGFVAGCTLSGRLCVWRPA